MFVSLQCGEKSFQALQISELGNGVLTILQLPVRSDVRDLRESHPDLARQFYDLPDQLDIVSSSFMQFAEHVSTSDSVYRRTLLNMFDKLLATIRRRAATILHCCVDLLPFKVVIVWSMLSLSIVGMKVEILKIG